MGRFFFREDKNVWFPTSVFVGSCYKLFSNMLINTFQQPGVLNSQPLPRYTPLQKKEGMGFMQNFCGKNSNQRKIEVNLAQYGPEDPGLVSVDRSIKLLCQEQPPGRYMSSTKGPLYTSLTNWLYIQMQVITPSKNVDLRHQLDRYTAVHTPCSTGPSRPSTVACSEGQVAQPASIFALQVAFASPPGTDSDLEAFSHNPTHGSFAALAARPTAKTKYAIHWFLSYLNGLPFRKPIIGNQQGKTNLSRDGLNPAHVPCQWVNNPTLGEFCFAMIGRADIEESKSDVAMNAWPPQASYPCGNFSNTLRRTRSPQRRIYGPRFLVTRTQLMPASGELFPFWST
ncbi:MAG: putative Regulator of rDNA transcription protein 15 [Streblomastix strix]|uniref:Putative Regulator of rDNA transcription protein 15 n=2 Tax=Streblomastix strix TaxID=222440 RepID=A0A5J4WRT6_9EUKA|nr:MAG: putative Regulator of rDNA transcription protein 15 [Streblomastix strix]